MVVQWSYGDVVVLRGIWKGELWWACPAYLVCDKQDCVGLYWRAGTPIKRWERRPTVQDLLNPLVQLVEAVWIDTDVLSLVIPGMAHSVDIMWEAGQHVQRCWYVHLQEPLRRTAIGFDTMDQILDIVISPDRTHWHWKDEDEFADATRIGVYSTEEAEEIWAEGERVIGMLNEQASPFCDGWENWVPPREWGIPRFPVGWDKVPTKKIG